MVTSFRNLQTAHLILLFLIFSTSIENNNYVDFLGIKVKVISLYPGNGRHYRNIRTVLENSRLAHTTDINTPCGVISATLKG